MISRLVYSRLAVAKNHPAKRVSRLIVMSQICGVDITFLLFGGWDGIGHGGYLGSLLQISTTCFIFFMITFSFSAVQCKVWVLEYALGRPSPKYVETYISSYRCWVSMNYAFKNDQRLVTYCTRDSVCILNYFADYPQRQQLRKVTTFEFYWPVTAQWSDKRSKDNGTMNQSIKEEWLDSYWR